MKFKPFRNNRQLNLLIVLRVLLGLLTVLAVVERQQLIGLFLFVLTVTIGFLDGFLAKRASVRSQFRSIFDPFADKILIVGVAFALFQQSKLAGHVLLVYLLKDLLFVLCAVVIFLKNVKTVFRSNVVDKVCAGVQMLALFFVLYGKPDAVLLLISVVFVVLSVVVSLFRSGTKIVKYRTDLQDISFRKLIKLPDLFTFMNLLMGIGSMFLVFQGKFLYASIALILAVLFDIFDGKVAKWMNAERDFGKNLDSLADTVSFGVAPAVFGFALEKSLLANIAFTLFILAGVLRLARYNIIEFTGEKEFTGMPITVNGLVVPLLFIFGVPTAAYPYVFLLLAVAMVSPVTIKKFF
jgi:CDP-diacylglycerol---serine O-phosphatidyltransferase